MEEEQFISWLLETKTPSIRYFTLRELCGLPEVDEEVQSARQAVMASGPVPTILAGQTESGRWSGEHSYYTPKFTSTHWSMTLLAELGADRSDPRLCSGAAYMVKATLNELDAALVSGANGFSCFWGNLLRYVLEFGEGCDLAVENLVEYILSDAVDGRFRCRYNGDLPCSWGAARTLWGLAALPAGSYGYVEPAIKAGLGLLLEEYELTRANYPTPGKVHHLWFQKNFPLFYQADILFVLRLLAQFDLLDHPGAGAAIEWLRSRRKADGTWRGASLFRRRTWRFFVDQEEVNRWVSLQAASLLRKIP